MFSLDVQACSVLRHKNSLSKSEDLRIIPPPSTAALLPVELSDCIASSMFLSSTLKTVVSTAKLVPPIIKSPSILASPPTCKVYCGEVLNNPTCDSDVSTTIASRYPVGCLTLTFQS